MLIEFKRIVAAAELFTLNMTSFMFYRAPKYSIFFRSYIEQLSLSLALLQILLVSGMSFVWLASIIERVLISCTELALYIHIYLSLISYGYPVAIFIIFFIYMYVFM